MGELRRDPVVNRWVIIDPERREREALFPIEEEVEEPVPCPFCPGRELEAGREIYAVGEPGRPPNAGGWWVRVIPDRHPILRIEGRLDPRPEGMFDLMNAVGAHELVVETPEHDRNWHELSELQLERVLKVWRERSLDLRKDERFRQVLMVKNYGRATTLFRHPHSHVLALPIVPKGVDEEIQGVLHYYRLKERCVYCDILWEEIKMKRRVLLESPKFMAFAPFASRFPFETWILPKVHLPDFGRIVDEEVEDLADVLKAIMGMLQTTLAFSSGSLILHTSPLHEYHRPEYHWHVEIVPKTSKVAGFEWGTGFFVNPIPPEEAAARLKEGRQARLEGI